MSEAGASVSEGPTGPPGGPLGPGPVKAFRGALIRSFGRTARADTRHPACFRASCDHGHARLTRYQGLGGTGLTGPRPSGTIAGERGTAAQLQALQPRRTILLES